MKGCAWSSDVCSSDLASSVRLLCSEQSAPRRLRARRRSSWSSLNRFRSLFPFVLLTRCDFHQRGANKFVAEAVAGDYLLHHRVRLIVVSSFCYDSLVNVGIELFTNSSNGLNTQRIEHAIQLFIDQIYAAKKMAELVRLR